MPGPGRGAAEELNSERRRRFECQWAEADDAIADAVAACVRGEGLLLRRRASATLWRSAWASARTLPPSWWRTPRCRTGVRVVVADLVRAWVLQPERPGPLGEVDEYIRQVARHC